MPGNLILVLVAWIATHLVSFSLLGFLVAGLFVFGVIDAPGFEAGTTVQAEAGAKPLPQRDAVRDSSGPTAPPREALDQSAPPQTAFKPVLPKSAADGAKQAGSAAKESPRKAPRLIGGSLPVYREPGTLPAAPGYLPPVGAESFRPPAEGAVTGPASLSRDESLQQARRAFWNGDFEAAEAAYMALISEYPADADAFGELGNLYQSMGKPAQALDAYYEAGIRLKAVGDTEKLQQIIDLFVQEGDSRATQLNP